MQTYMLLFIIFLFFIVVLGPLPFQFILYLLKVYIGVKFNVFPDAIVNI